MSPDARHRWYRATSSSKAAGVSARARRTSVASEVSRFTRPMTPTGVLEEPSSVAEKTHVSFPVVVSRYAIWIPLMDRDDSQNFSGLGGQSLTG